MAKPLKVLLSVFGILFLMLVGALIALPLLVDPNDYRDRISQAVEENTGRPFALGELELKVFPWIRLRVNDAVLGNAEGFSDEPFARVGKVDLGVHLLPLLLRRELIVSAVTLSGLSLSLERLADGRSNWEDLAQPKEPLRDRPQQEGERGSRFDLRQIDIAGIVIENANISYTDAQTGQSLRVEDFDFRTGRLAPGRPFDADSSVRIRLGEPELTLSIIFGGRIAPDDQFSRIGLQGLKLHVTASGDRLVDGKPLTAKLSVHGEGTVHPAEPRVDARNLAVTLETGGTDTPNGLGLKTANRLSVAQLNANLGPAEIEGGQRVSLRELSLTGDVHGKALVNGQDFAAKYGVSGGAEVDLRHLRAVVQDLLVHVETGGRDTPNALGLAGKLELRGSPIITASENTLRWGDLALDFDVKHPEGSAKGRFASVLFLDWARPRLGLPEFGIEATVLSPQLKGPEPVRVRGHFNYEGDAHRAQMREFALEALGLSLAARLNATELNSDTPRISGKLDLAEFSPKAALARLKLEEIKTTDPKALTRFGFQADVDATPKRLSLKDLRLRLDDTTATGQVEVRDFATQAVRFDLNLGAIDLDRYLPPDDGKPKPTPAAGGPPLNEIALPAEALDALNAEGTLRVDRLKVSGVTLTDARVTLSGPKGQPKRQQIRARLYGGGIDLDHQFTPGAKPGYAVKARLENFNAGPFLKDLLGEDYVSGLAQLNLDLSGQGLNVGQLRQSLNGNLGFEVRNGAVRGFNLAQALRRAEAALTGNLAGARAEAATTESTDFATLTGTARIVNGVLKTDDLSAASPLFRFTGSGSVDLAKETIDFLARPTVVQTLTGQDGKALENLRGLTIPIQLSGSLFQPRVRIDIQEALKNRVFDGARERLKAEEAQIRARVQAEEERARERLEREEDQLRQRATEALEQRLGPGAGESLRGLLGRGRASPSPSPTPAAAATPAASPPPAATLEPVTATPAPAEDGAG